MQQQLDALHVKIDSLSQADSLYRAQLDSVQQAMNDSIASLHHQIGGLIANGNADSLLGSHLLWFILGLLAICLLWWLVKKHKNMDKINLNPDYDGTSEFLARQQNGTQGLSAVALPSVAAVASDTRKTINQDWYAEASVENLKARIISVADGVGSSNKAEEGSRRVATKAVELVKQALESKGTVDFDSLFDKIQIDFDRIFNAIQEDLDAQVESDYQDDLSQIKPASFASTLIVGVDFPDRFIAAYVGNGSIWHVSGLFNTFPSMVCLPWNAVNLLTPDTIMNDGKEALYKIFFYKGEKKHHKPTVLQISKLNEAPGDIFIITTDGVYSSDHAIAGKDDGGDIWIPSTAQFGLLHDALKAYVEGKEDINDSTLKQMLVGYLANLKETKIMDDDTTLGVFISAEAKKHFMDKRKENEAN